MRTFTENRSRRLANVEIDVVNEQYHKNPLAGILKVQCHREVVVQLFDT